MSHMRPPLHKLVNIQAVSRHTYYEALKDFQTSMASLTSSAQLLVDGNLQPGSLALVLGRLAWYAVRRRAKLVFPFPSLPLRLLLFYKASKVIKNLLTYSQLIRLTWCDDCIVGRALLEYHHKHRKLNQRVSLEILLDC